MKHWPVALLLISLGACVERRPREAAAVTYDDVAPILDRACVDCHGAEDGAASYSVRDHWSAIGCAEDGASVILPRDERAPLIAVLRRRSHRGLLSADERTRLLSWVEAGAPGRRSVIHAQGILDPRSSGWHGALAAKDRFIALRDPDHELACGRCHQDAPVTPKGATRTDGATACSHCHQERAGVLACATCHGAQGRSYPPRDACYFDAPDRDPHAAHIAPPTARMAGFDCSTCHPTPSADVLSGQHANGKVDVRFTSPLVGDDDTFADGSCTVGCHTRGGSRDTPDWNVEAPLDCQSCHRSPPADHPPGSCDTCHDNMGAEPDSLIVDARHMNGKVDLGDGSGTCGACHGEGERGAPADAGHRQHLDTLLTTSFSCDTCHRVPELTDLHQPSTHMNGSIEIELSGRAATPQTSPVFDAEQRTCAQVACHGDLRPDPRWNAPHAPEACTACHDTPPPPPHSRQPGCGGALCHGSEVAATSTGYFITEPGRALHIDGMVQP